MKTKKCQTCGEKNTKKLTKNSSRRNAKDELVENFLCRSCRNKRRANWYHTHKEAKEVVMSLVFNSNCLSSTVFSYVGLAMDFLSF